MGSMALFADSQLPWIALNLLFVDGGSLARFMELNGQEGPQMLLPAYWVNRIFQFKFYLHTGLWIYVRACLTQRYDLLILVSKLLKALLIIIFTASVLWFLLASVLSWLWVEERFNPQGKFVLEVFLWVSAISSDFLCWGITLAAGGIWRTKLCGSAPR